MPGPIVLKKLLSDRHWQSHRTFCLQYDKAAQTVSREFVGSYPSRPQLHRWLNGELKGLPHPHNCQVLQAMFPGVTISEMFEPLATTPAGNGANEPDVGALVAAGLSAPASHLGGWRADQLSPAGARSAPFVPGQTEKLGVQGPGGAADQLARAVLLLGKRLRLTDAEVTELAKLAGHLVDLELDCSIDIDTSGESEVTYRFQMVNLTDKPVKRMSREQWFEHTDGRLQIEAHPSSDRTVQIQRIHDTPNMAKFACVFSPAVQPGEVATIAYTTRGGKFLNDHYWRQSAPRYTRHMTLTIRHRGVDLVQNYTAIVDDNDGAQHSAIDDLVCTYEDGDALITLTRDYLQPNDAVTIRWQVTHGGA